MLSQSTIKEYAVKWQTTPLNVAREYLQHVFLSTLYQAKESELLAFKGGTALRMLYRSPRFSEDLDFSGHLTPYHLESLLKQTVGKVAVAALPIETIESKPTSGGYLALYRCNLYDESVGIELNISLRRRVKPEPILVTTPLLPPYQCLALSAPDLVTEKCEALLARRKMRDFYDLYFLLRERLAVQSIVPLKSRLIDAVNSLESKMASRELKAFLPVSHHRVISNLRQALITELNRL
ncbi:MAG: nucleotidyl transferase AbiEii/AbiGii toxin family protein [Elusimicrobia bacterium]|nr:nucleotidyl transferase AbiEii/AbiGii toxin family protein [Candidatus Obscuribacterium magneticum]